MPRRFPPPWTVEEGPAYFIVPDANRQKLVYSNFFRGDYRRSPTASHTAAPRTACDHHKAEYDDSATEQVADDVA